MYSTSIQRRLFGETLEIIRAALHGEPATKDDTGASLDLPSAAPGTVSGVGPGDAASDDGSSIGDASAGGASGNAEPGRDTSAAGTVVPTARAAAAFFRSAAWDAPRTGITSANDATVGGANADALSSSGAPDDDPATATESVPAAPGPDDRRNVRAVLAAAAWDGDLPSARVIPLDRESSQEDPGDRDADAEAFQRAATESALAAARGGRGS